MLKFINLKKLTAKALIGVLVAGSLVAQSGKKAVASNGVQGIELRYADSALQCGSDSTQADIKVEVSDENGKLLTTMSKGDTFTSAEIDSINDLRLNYRIYNLDCLTEGSSRAVQDTKLLGSNDTIPNLSGFSGQNSVSQIHSSLDSYEELYLVELGTSNTSSAAYDLQDVVLVVDNNPTSLTPPVDDGTVSLELVLSVDVSTSVNNTEYNTQVQGYKNAFNDEDVQQAIKDLPKGLAVTMQFWGSDDVADIGWFKLIRNGDDIDGLTEFTTAINNVNRNKNTRSVRINGTTTNLGGGTNIKMAIEEAVSLIQNNDYTGDRLVIDVSGDGVPDDTPYPEATRTWEYGYKDGECGYTLDCPPVVNARDAAVAAGITINGLPINNSNAGSKTITDNDGNVITISKYGDQIDDYYRTQVVGGTNSFSLLADGFDDFARAARLKILKEISDDPTCSASDKCVSPNNDPVAEDDKYQVSSNTETSLDVTINDTDVDGDSLTISGYDIDENSGSLTIDTSNNQLVYAAPQKPGTYTFMYEVYDGKGGIDKAEVEVEVQEFAD